METTIGANAQTSQLFAVGFSDQDIDQMNTTIDYAFTVSGQAATINQNSPSGTATVSGGVVLGDRLRISRNGNTIRYYKNGILVYTSLVAGSTALMIDFSLNSLSSNLAFTRFSAAQGTAQSITRTYSYDHAGR